MSFLKDECCKCYTIIFLRNTAEDTFGRVESEHSFTAANTFKLDSWHTLILLKKHHPLNWTYVEYSDLMNTAQKWLVYIVIALLRYINEGEEFIIPIF